MAGARTAEDLPRVAYACSPHPWFDHPEATPHRQAVLRALIRIAGKRYHCSPTRQRIMDVSKVGRNSVIEAIRWLVEVGAIVIVPDDEAASLRRFVFQWRRAEGAPEPVRGRAEGRRAPGAPEPVRGRAEGRRALLGERERERERDTVSSRPPSHDGPTPAKPSPPPRDETRRDAPISGDGGGGPGSGPPARPPDPRRLDAARRLRARLLDGHGYECRADADRSGLVLAPLPHLRAHLPDLDDPIRAAVEALRPELLALALGATAGAAPPSPRDPAHPLGVAEAMIRDDPADGLAGRLMLHLCARWGDRPNPTTRALFEDAVALLGRDRLLRRVREADAKDRPANYLAATLGGDLGAARGRPRAGRGHRPPGQPASNPRGPAHERQSA